MNEILVGEWVAKAEEDYEVMRRASAGETEPVGDIIGFLAQQVVEKYLKAFMVFRGLAPPRTHSLGALLDALGGTDPDLSSWRQNIETLTPFAVEFRYPGASATAEQVRQVVEIATRFRRHVRRILELAGCRER